MRRFVCLMAGIILCFSSCDEPFDGPFRPYQEDPIASYLEHDPSHEFSDWVAVLKKTEFFSTLNLTSMQQTHFAVKNGPLQAYARAHFGVDNILDVDTETLKSVVRYHTIPNYIISARNMNGKINRRTAERNYLTAVFEPKGADREEDLRYILNGDNDPSIIIQSDIKTTNGYIHVLDTPLIMEFKDIMAVLKEREEFSIFVDALEMTGLDAYLRNTSVTFRLGRDQKEETAREEKTVFAIPNDILIGSYNVENCEQLKRYIDAEVGPSADPTQPSTHFWQFVAYHIVPKRMSYSDLSSFPLDPAKNDGISRLKKMTIYPYNTIRSLTKGISIQDQLLGLKFNPHQASVGNSFEINSAMRDIPASNGYIHGITNIMLKPERMAFYPVEYEPTSELPFQSIPFYQDDVAAGVAPNEFEILNGDVPTLRWTELSSDTRVWYSNLWMANGRFLNQDALFFTLGSVGYIDIDIPPLPITTNDMRIATFVEKSIDQFEGGIYNVTLNRGSLGTRNFKTGPAFEKWDYGDIRFGTEDPATIRFKVGAAGGVAGIDRFIFMPCYTGGSVVSQDDIWYYAEDIFSHRND